MEILSLGLKTTLLGMAIVFVCLLMLMIIINIMSFIMKKVKPKEEVGPQSEASPEPLVVEEIPEPMAVEGINDDEIAAIAAVIAYMDAEGASQGSYTIGRPQRVKSSLDPWNVSAKQDLINSKL